MLVTRKGARMYEMVAKCVSYIRLRQMMVDPFMRSADGRRIKLVAMLFLHLSFSRHSTSKYRASGKTITIAIVRKSHDGGCLILQYSQT